MRRGALSMVVLAGFVTARAAAADAGRCEAAIVIASARELRAVAHAVRACALAGSAGEACPDRLDVARAILRARHGAAGTIARACCGRDHACGTDDDLPVASAGWSAGFCPGLGAGVECGDPVRHPGEIADCLACTDRLVVTRLAAVGFAGPATSAPRRCRAAVGAASVDLLVARSRLLARCWAARARGRHGEDCPLPADVATLAQIAADASARVCRVCGGADRACGGADDASPAALSFPADCPDVTAPGGTSCSRPVATLADLVACVTCVVDASAECADRIAVPAFAPDPPECHPPSAPCQAGVQCGADADCPRGYTCTDNGGDVRYCIGPACTDDAACRDGAVCRQYCAFDGCHGRRCQCPGFGCTGAGELCLGTDALACRKLCTQDSDCVDPLGLGVCVNSGFASGLCIHGTPCQ